jgi:hypothetical protein
MSEFQPRVPIWRTSRNSCHQAKLLAFFLKSRKAFVSRVLTQVVGQLTKPDVNPCCNRLNTNCGARIRDRLRTRPESLSGKSGADGQLLQDIEDRGRYSA